MIDSTTKQRFPQPIGSEAITIEEHPVRLIEVGGADGALATVVHIPDLDTVCAGDAVYNNIHMWLWNSTPASRQTWLATVDAVSGMNPATIIAGHKDPMRPTTMPRVNSLNHASTSNHSTRPSPNHHRLKTLSPG